MTQQRRWWGVPAWSVIAVALVLVQGGLDAGLDTGRIPGGMGTQVAIWTLWAVICLVALVELWWERRRRVDATLHAIFRGKR